MTTIFHLKALSRVRTMDAHLTVQERLLLPLGAEILAPDASWPSWTVLSSVPDPIQNVVVVTCRPKSFETEDGEAELLSLMRGLRRAGWEVT